MHYFATLLALGLLWACSSTDTNTQSESNSLALLGQLEHSFQLAPELQANFDKGLLLLHNFEYDDAMIAFESVIALDSTEILAYWGAAMCHYKALWKLQNTEEGIAILQRVAADKAKRLAKISDTFNKEVWELVELMYGEGEFEQRNLDIKEHLATLHQKYPKHQEVAAFYALSLIWSTDKYGDASQDLRLAANICDKIIAVNPLHPGALHYKIHALDGPTSAKDAVDAADAYAKVAPNAAHALHMPSHIYLALGEWNAVVRSNQASFDASVKRMQQQDLKDGARGYHSLAWMHYGLLQQGQYRAAEKVLQDMLEYVPKDPTKGARGYLLAMQSRQLASTEKLDSTTLLDLNIKVDDIGVVAKAVRSFLRTQIAFQNQNKTTIEKEIEWLSSQIYSDSLNLQKTGAAMCAAGNSRYAPTENSINTAKVMLLQMKGYKALQQQQIQAFQSYLKQAIILENKTNYPTGPPKIILPSFEQYGLWLLENKQFAEACAQFDKALLRMPKRSQSLVGKMRALRALNQASKALEVQHEIEQLFMEADSSAQMVLGL
jgi:tetratricopeptide (TPR) repeat protein